MTNLTQLEESLIEEFEPYFRQRPSLKTKLHTAFSRYKEGVVGHLDTLTKDGEVEIESTGDGWRAYVMADYENPIWKPTLGELIKALR